VEKLERHFLGSALKSEELCSTRRRAVVFHFRDKKSASKLAGADDQLLTQLSVWSALVARPANETVKPEGQVLFEVLSFLRVEAVIRQKRKMDCGVGTLKDGEKLLVTIAQNSSSERENAE
jgi:hypothetical protein